MAHFRLSATELTMGYEGENRGTEYNHLTHMPSHHAPMRNSEQKN